MSDAPSAQPEKRRRLDRVVAACDLCKRRKVKCDGAQPCAYCKRKNRAATCSFSAAKERGQALSAANTPNAPASDRDRNTARGRAHSEGNTHVSRSHQPEPEASPSPTASRDDHHGDTAVPLEGRILRDAQGKVIFIGDCAPLSFLQTVRYLVSSEVDPDGFAVQTSRDSMIEVARPQPMTGQASSTRPSRAEIRIFAEEYCVVTSGLVDLFEREDLLKEIVLWSSSLATQVDDTAEAVFYLVLAMGAQEKNEAKAEAWFTKAQEVLVKNMCNSMNVATVQGFTLVAIYMLRAFQPNGAYLYFSLAARTAYAIGIHRTEVNASFGVAIRGIRDRIWKSLRVVDMLISTILGRPPSTSDVDCTVKYSVVEQSRPAQFHALDPSVEIFMIIERVVVEVYSRKRISIRIADYVSRQLRGWASKWLQVLTDTIAQPATDSISRAQVVGSCSTLCSYYYGIMLLTRPFLIYEIYEHLGASMRGGGSQNDHQEKRKYADAALDAASSFIESLQAVLNSKTIPQRMPLVVPWLFTTALVLAVGILGRSGLIFEDSCRASIRCLDYFGESDPHARQYSVIVQSLLKITTAHVKKREIALHLQRKQASSELFGLLPTPSHDPMLEPHLTSRIEGSSEPAVSNTQAQNMPGSTAPFDWTMYDADFFALPWPSENDRGLQDFLQPGTHNLDGATIADIPLFPIYDQQTGGGFGW
ncbi:hypothetical protein FB567DRAFT_279613 [Paraphoma chrysanthemicola]|uniref:Zn(2)-C6 fungal-type domain-containing protein n=1 Tax=Paraphoma chrysanthemicola TaxID=798071 RepID=A0A8K0RCK2_9PLEO|nr:hypothetical protein FB567DRAFT_279613 [Paraphoma chrysanthemicola]